MSRTTTQSRLEIEELVFAITCVSAATAAGRARDDLDMAAVLSDYYALVAEADGWGTTHGWIAWNGESYVWVQDY